MNQDDNTDLCCFLCKSVLFSRTQDKGPMDVLLKLLLNWTGEDLSREDTDLLAGLVTSGETSVDFCQACIVRLTDYDALVQKIQWHLGEFKRQFQGLLALQAQARLPDPTDTSKLRRSARKACHKKLKPQSAKVTLDEPESDNFVVKFSSLVTLTKETFDVLSSGQDSDYNYNETLLEVLKQVYPKCLLRLDKSNCTCKLKYCAIQIKSTLTEDLESGDYLMMVSSNGSPNHPDNEDSERRIFELSKQEFLDEKICQFCCKTFEHEKDLLEHKEQESEHACPKCDQVFRTFPMRNSHYLNVHALDSPYPCQKCFKSFKTSAKCQEHQKGCFSETRYSCEACYRTFTSLRNLDTHIEVVHLKTETKWAFQCQKCQKRFYKKTNLKSHLLSHEKEKTLVCSVEGCDRKFKRQKALQVHLAKLHGNSRESHLCPFCGKNFATQSGMKLHLEKHTGKEYVKRNVFCQVCGKGFRCKADLSTHSVVHSKEKPHVCHICKTSFTQKSSLKDHLNVHANTYQCHKCNKSFGRQRYLDQHERLCGQLQQDESRPADEGPQGERPSHSQGSQTLFFTTKQNLDGTSVLGRQEVQCVIIHDSADGGDGSLNLVTDPQKLHLVPSADGTYVVKSDSIQVNDLSHFNQQGTIAMLEYTESLQQ